MSPTPPTILARLARQGAAPAVLRAAAEAAAAYLGEVDAQALLQRVLRARGVRRRRP